jgi:uncharacterized protein YcfJ
MKMQCVPRLAVFVISSVCLAACNQQDAPGGISAAVAGTPPVAAVAADLPPRVVACDSCGIVRSVTELKTDGRASGAGAVIGGIVGGVAGNQVGGGSGRTIATAAGVVGGAILGNEVEQNRNASTTYEIVVDMQGGGQQVVSVVNAAGINPGTPVSVQGGNISLR